MPLSYDFLAQPPRYGVSAQYARDNPSLTFLYDAIAR